MTQRKQDYVLTAITCLAWVALLIVADMNL